MHLYIKNMVCHRCKLVVETELKKLGLNPVNIELGDVLLSENDLDPKQVTAVKNAMESVGFELLDSRKSKVIEKIKSVIINSIHHTDEILKQKYSELISAELHHDYPSLSKLFSETEGITIEQFIINQKIERAKELLIYDELSLSQIADSIGYSSVAHLSAQFKKVTGLTPSVFKGLRENKRKGLDEV